MTDNGGYYRSRHFNDTLRILVQEWVYADTYLDDETRTAAYTRVGTSL